MSVKCKAFQSCVLPILEYASTCWAPTSQKLNNSLEMVLHNGAKFATNKYPKKGDYSNFSITKMLSTLNWQTLEQRRNQARLTMAFKILNNHVILEPDLLPKILNPQPERVCKGVKVGNTNQLVEPRAKLDTTSATFFYSIPKLWNNQISSTQANSPSVDAFQSKFKQK